MEKKVSISNARRILGNRAKGLEDDQVKELVLSLHLIAHEQLLYNSSKVKENGNERQQSGKKTH